MLHTINFCISLVGRKRPPHLIFSSTQGLVRFTDKLSEPNQTKTMVRRSKWLRFPFGKLQINPRISLKIDGIWQEYSTRWILILNKLFLYIFLCADAFSCSLLLSTIALHLLPSLLEKGRGIYGYVLFSVSVRE